MSAVASLQQAMTGFAQQKKQKIDQKPAGSCVFCKSKGRAGTHSFNECRSNPASSGFVQPRNEKGKKGGGAFKKKKDNKSPPSAKGLKK